MQSNSEQLRRELALAHRILVGQGVLEAFGHISLRNPDNPEEFCLPRALPPSCVTADDVLLFDGDSKPVHQTDQALFSESCIHAAIFRARPDVMARSEERRVGKGWRAQGRREVWEEGRQEHE